MTFAVLRGYVRLVLKERRTNKQLREEKIKKYDERINQFSNAAKSVLASMNFKNLKKVKQEPNIRDLYRFFFINLYHEVPEDYNFDDFCKIALDKDINDFQKRLAKFSIYKLSKESRERIQNLRERDYSLNTTNDDFNFLLEWLDYNFEAYLSLKEKISEENTLKEINKKESVKTIQSNAANKMVQDLDGLVTYLEESLRHLNLYEKKLSEAAWSEPTAVTPGAAFYRCAVHQIASPSAAECSAERPTAAWCRPP